MQTVVPMSELEATALYDASYLQFEAPAEFHGVGEDAYLAPRAVVNAQILLGGVTLDICDHHHAVLMLTADQAEALGRSLLGLAQAARHPSFADYV